MKRISLRLMPFAAVFSLFLARSARAEVQVGALDAPPPSMESPSRPPAWGPTHPFAVTVRAPVRLGEGYVFGGVGGQVRLRPFERLRLDLFFDNFMGQRDGTMRHDHEVGTTIQWALFSSERFVVYPMFGFCAMWAMLDPHDAPGVSDIRFGIHGGVGAEVALGGGFSLALNVEAVPYFGHTMKAYDRTAFVENGMTVMPTGQANLGLSYWF